METSPSATGAPASSSIFNAQSSPPVPPKKLRLPVRVCRHWVRAVLQKAPDQLDMTGFRCVGENRPTLLIASIDVPFTGIECKFDGYFVAPLRGVDQATSVEPFIDVALKVAQVPKVRSEDFGQELVLFNESLHKGILNLLQGHI